MFQRLLENHADSKANEHNQTPVCHLTSSSGTKIVQLSLERHADIKTIDKYKLIPVQDIADESSK